MKTYHFLLFLMFFASKTIAQEGQSYVFDLKNNADLKKIRIVSADNFDVIYININDLQFTNAPFIAASVRIEGQRLDERQIIQIHAHDATKNSLDYKSLHRFHENEEDPTRLFVSELAYLDKKTSDVQVICRVEKPALEKVNMIQVRLFNPTNLPPVKAVFAPDGACDAPPSVARSIWGASLGLSNGVQYKNTPAYSPVTHLIVHHSDGPNTSTNWAATVVSIFDYHVNSNGWSDVGYNYLIAPDGTLFYGRGGGNNVVGAHYCAKNNNTMGVCMIGNYMKVAPTDTAWRTLERIFSWKAIESNINPTDLKPLSDLGSIPVVNGHRSGCATDCPGDSTFNRLPALRQRLATIVTACRSVGTKDLSILGQIRLSPNPVFDGKLTLSTDIKTVEDIEIKAFDALGRQVFNESFGANNLSFLKEIDVSNFIKGAYLFKIKIGNAYVFNKIIIE